MLSYLLRSITWSNIVVLSESSFVFLFLLIASIFLYFIVFPLQLSTGIYYTIECIYLCTIILALINQILGYVYEPWTVFHWSQRKKSDYNKYWFCTAENINLLSTDCWFVFSARCEFFLNYKLHNTLHLLLHVILHNVTNTIVRIVF